jgi:hypothetical protein
VRTVPFVFLDDDDLARAVGEQTARETARTGADLNDGAAAQRPRCPRQLVCTDLIDFF